MQLGAMSTVLADRSLEDAARKMHELGLLYIEIGAGGFFPKNHCDPAQLLSDPTVQDEFRSTLAKFELRISALAMHGEPLHPDPAIARQYGQEFRDTCALAEKLEVKKMTLLAGLPEAAPGDKVPNWILFPWPVRNLELWQWQWEKRLIPYWKEHARIAEDHGVQLCFEMHPGDMVFNTESLLRLRDAVGPTIGCNLDPSHLLWQGMDIIEVVRTLGGVICHTHAKDNRVDDHNVRVNGILDPKDFQERDDRSWIFRTVGYGHSEYFWRGFISALRQVGYDDVLSIEHEDPLIDPEEGLEFAVAMLQRILPRKPPGRLWYE